MGMSNLGNTCYINASVQCLSHTAPLCDYFRKGLWQRDVNASNPLGSRGELALGFGVTQGDATKLERALDLHVMHLLVHGFLHLLGHDHMSPAEASEMEGLEAQILMPLGLPDPYGDAA